jgi:predicted anti-sigma-YlaC factor YlaD
MKHIGKDCSHIRTAISSRLDGEETGVPADIVAAHLVSCAGCRRFERDAAALHRATRLAPAPAVPDLAPGVLRAIGEVGAPAKPEGALRVGLAIVALVQIGLAAPALLLGDDAGLPVHTARHLGSFAVALGVGFLFAAWRPARVAGLFPVAAALVACLVVTSLVDVTTGRAGAGNEMTHATELVGLAALWLLSRAHVSWKLPGAATA